MPAPELSQATTVSAGPAEFEEAHPRHLVCGLVHSKHLVLGLAAGGLLAVLGTFAGCMSLLRAQAEPNPTVLSGLLTFLASGLFAHCSVLAACRKRNVSPPPLRGLPCSPHSSAPSWCCTCSCWWWR